MFKHGDSSDDLDDGDELEDVRPGTEFDLEVKFESKFDDKEELDIENIELTVESDGLNIEEDEDSGDLVPEEEETITVRFDIEDDQDKGREGPPNQTDRNGRIRRRATANHGKLNLMS